MTPEELARRVSLESEAIRAATIVMAMVTLAIGVEIARQLGMW